jgi:glycosyltransferase involved in cell wall biosynthesis
LIKVQHSSGKSGIERIVNLIFTHVKISLSIIQNHKTVDTLFFFISDTNFLPIIIAKMLGKKIILIMGGNVSYEIITSGDPIQKPLIYLRKINLLLANNIILYSENLITAWGLERYSKKIVIAHRHFINLHEFALINPIKERNAIIGFIGRLSEEKGIINFVSCLPALVEKGYIIWICGSGHLNKQIELFIKENNLAERVILKGWIPHNRLPQCLNELKLLVVPSYSEGLPNIILESMACGTPVLATSVGAIPSLINSGDNGLIMENNSADCIEKNIIQALNFNDLEKIASNGRSFIEENFTFEKVVLHWKKILQDVS